MNLDEKKPTFNPKINKEYLYTPWELEQMKKEKAKQRMERRKARQAQSNPDNTAEPIEESTENTAKEKKPSVPLYVLGNTFPYGTLIGMGVFSLIVLIGTACYSLTHLPMCAGIMLSVTGVIMEIRHKKGNRVFEHYLVAMGVIYVILGKIAYDRGTSVDNGIVMTIAMCALLWCGYQLVAIPIESLTRKAVCTEIVSAVISDYHTFKHTTGDEENPKIFYTYLPVFSYEYNSCRYRTAATSQVDDIPAKGAQYGLRVNPRCPSEVYDRADPGRIDEEKVLAAIVLGIISLIVLSRTL